MTVGAVYPRPRYFMRREVLNTFNSYEFTFAGESSAMYGLMIYDFGGISQDKVSFGNTASIVESRTNNRIRPIHFGVNYHKSPLQFKLVFGSSRALDRYEMESISMWLTGHQNYQWLSIDQPDLSHVEFHCLVTRLTPLHHGWLPVAFEATVLCDCPYAYGLPFEYNYQIDGTYDILIRNNSSVREYIKPTIKFQPKSGGFLQIFNHNDNNREFLLESLPYSTVILVDNENCIIRDEEYGYNLYGSFNMNFFRLVQGDNNLTVSAKGLLTISGRFLHNVAG